MVNLEEETGATANAYVWLRGGCVDPFNCVIANNLWYCNDADACKSANHPVTANVTIKNNYYYGNAHNGSETAIQQPGSDETPFTNFAGEDFSLANDGNSALNNGYAAGSPYNVDRIDTARPQGAAYDIGAYEYITGEGDVTAPAVTFTLPATATGLTVTPSSFSCTDAVGVTGYCLQTSSDSGDCSWSGTAQTSITFAADGEQTAYAFCKDAADNIGTASKGVTIELKNVFFGTGALLYFR